MNIFDLHCDTLLLGMLDDKHSLRSNSGQISLEKMRKGSVSAQCFAIYVPCYEEAEEYGIRLSPYEYYRQAVSLYKKELAENADSIRPALCAADILRNLEGGFLSSVLAIEDSVPLDGKSERLNEFYNDGVRMISLTWNYVNQVAHPNSRDAAKHALGLTEFGRECLEIMGRLGIIADVSHLSEGGFFEVARLGKPFAASHSCARALCDHPRNLSDEQLRTLADCGGVVGLSLVPSFLAPGSSFGTVEDIVRHALHIKNTAGIESLSLGSDFDGFSDHSEISDCSKYPLLIRSLENKFSSEEIDKICFGNALRVFKDICE